MIYLPFILTLLLIGPALASIAFLRSLSTRVHLLLFGICIFYGIFPLLLSWGGISLRELQAKNHPTGQIDFLGISINRSVKQIGAPAIEQTSIG